MTATTLRFAPTEAQDSNSATPVAIPSPLAFLRRIGKLMAGAQQRRADNEVGRYIEMHGGVLTDELERQISRNYGRVVGS